MELCPDEGYTSIMGLVEDVFRAITTSLYLMLLEHSETWLSGSQSSLIALFNVSFSVSSM